MLRPKAPRCPQHLVLATGRAEVAIASPDRAADLKQIQSLLRNWETSSGVAMGCFGGPQISLSPQPTSWASLGGTWPHGDYQPVIAARLLRRIVGFAAPEVSVIT